MTMTPTRIFPLLLLQPALAQTFSSVLPQDKLVFAVGEAPGGGALAAIASNGGASSLFLLEADGTPRRAWRVNHWLTHLAWSPSGAIVCFGHVGKRPWAVAVDPTTGVLWSTLVEDWDGPDYEFAGFQNGAWCAGGGVIAVGHAYDYESTDHALLVRFAADGTASWSRALEIGGTSEVIELPDASFLVATGFSNPLGGWGTELRRFSAQGDLLWTKRSFDGGGSVSLAALASGSIVLVTRDGAALQLDPDGNVLDARRLLPDVGETNLHAVDAAATSDGGFAVVGYHYANGSDVRAWKFDVAGEVQWQRRLGGSATEWAYGVAGCAQGGLVVGGRSGAEGLLVRLDGVGDLAGCSPLPGWTAVEPTSWTWVDVGASAQPEPAAASGGPGLPSVGLPVPANACLGGQIGGRVCDPAVPNSSGLSAVIWGAGSPVVATNDLELAATALPEQQIGIFVAGQSFGTSVPPGSQGVFCLAGGAFHRLAPVLSSRNVGAFGQRVDLSSIPGHGPVLPGETWYFQAWFRDKNPGSTSNFTDAVGIAFR